MAEIDLIKISELPATSTIGDADELAVVQGGATKKVPYSVLKAGAEVTPDTTLSEAGVPADAAAVGAALALKANQAAVTQALAAKADKTEVTDISGDIAELASVVETKADQTALNQKADKTTTDALRQDLTTLNGIVSQKADKTELNTQIGNVTAELATKANTADVNNLLAAKANVASPVFTGRPQAPTAAKGTATLQLATTEFVQNAIDDKEDKLTFDTAPTQGSTNPVTSGGVYTALEDAKEDAETAIGEVREESEEATTEAREIALKAFATPTASGSLLTLTDGADGIPAKKLTLNLSPHQSGSGDPSPENVRSISGWNSVNVTRAGKNLASVPDTVFTMGNVRAKTFSNPITLPAGTYTLSATLTNSTKTKGLTVAVRNSQTGSENIAVMTFGAAESGRKSLTFTSAIPIDRFYVYLSTSEEEGKGGTLTNFMLEAGSTATDYAEYITPAEYDITIPSEAGTVYGGSLVVDQDGSGTLTVDSYGFEITAADVRSFQEITEVFYVTTPNRPTDTAFTAQPVGLYCNRLPSLPRSSVRNPKMQGICYDTGISRLQFCLPGITALEDAQTWLTNNPLMVVYRMASPITYELSAEEVVTTLLGDNTIFMDADGSIDLTYRADTQKYIDSRIALLNSNLAYIEDGMTASRAYSVGQFVLISGQLYKVTSAIASGATFTVGTNVVATTVGNELTALN